jgi:hypothetical protein
MEEMRNVDKFQKHAMKGRNYLEDLSIDGGNIKLDLKEKCNWDVDWTHLAQERPQ